ncbi:hypothetical protein RBU61_17040 [Tissierella sp. MB52-C2]|uniref:hypothetical protein n=1 Tax=Tissierella sp. MB52-C2 TaxID=3070999 RepID=UPI00280BF4AF|nr:hypothetical protein [Tissierella sp. MB52-C2]WMM24616.1 hypothetical protein RBU61_17040 [Tissierella sp. MB52-C2]
MANLVNVVSFMFSIEVIKIIFNAFDGSGTGLDMTRICRIVDILFAYMIVMFIAEKPAYRHSYCDAYALSAEDRANLAEHLRKLSLGYITSRDPGDLANMMMGDFTLIETGVFVRYPCYEGL